MAFSAQEQLATIPIVAQQSAGRADYPAKRQDNTCTVTGNLAVARTLLHSTFYPLSVILGNPARLNATNQ